MNPVVHFEMPLKDRERGKKFYEEALGWKLTQLGEDMMNYVLATTAPTGGDGMVTEPGAINGGLYDWSEDMKEPSVVVSVDNLDEAIKRVKKAGGEIIGEPLEIPGIGMFVSIKDTEGNRLGMMEPVPMN